MTAYLADPVSLRPHEVKAVFRYLAGEGGDGGQASALAVARATGLSTLVVIPALEHLGERGLVARSVCRGRGRGWVYQLTADGRRAAHSNA